MLTQAFGIHLFPIEMPSPSSPVNVYLVDDSPLTLVDTGPNLVDTLTQIERGLEGLGYAAEDLERIILTHPHIDHIGTASMLRARSGAEVWAPAGADLWLGDYRTHDRWLRDWREALMLAHGVPKAIAATRTHGAAFRNSWDPSVEVDHLMRDGDMVPFADRTWLVMSRPGHSPFDVLLGDLDRRHMLVGDHLIEHISSNALITPELGQEVQDRPHTLEIYQRSLRLTAELPAILSLSGHGVPISDHRALIDRRLASMDRRTARIHAVLANGPHSAHEIARVIWEDAAVTQAWLTVSEVLGHLDRLIHAGSVREVGEPGGPIHFECIATPPDHPGGH